MKHRRAKILVTLVVAFSGVALLAFQSLGDVEYYVHVEKLTADPARWFDYDVIQVHGYVVPGTIKVEQRREEAMLYRSFELESKGERIAVRHRGAIPDTFKDQAETVVKGKLLREGDALVLRAVDGENGIMAKCPSKYEAGKPR